MRSYYDKWRNLLKIVFFGLFYFYPSNYSFINAQCVVAEVTMPNCIVANNTVTFFNNTDETNIISSAGWSNISCSLDYYWEVYDSTLTNPIFTSNSNNLIFNFPYSGEFLVYLEPIPNGGTPNQCCPGGPLNDDIDPWFEYIYVIDSSFSVQLNDSIQICEDETIDVTDIGLKLLWELWKCFS